MVDAPLGFTVPFSVADPAVTAPAAEVVAVGAAAGVLKGRSFPKDVPALLVAYALT